MLDIRTGEFSLVYDSTVKKLQENRNSAKLTEKEENSLFMYNPEKRMRELIIYIHGILEKIFIFIMGILPGMALIHIFLINQGLADDLKAYTLSSLRLNQLLHIITLIACVGSIYLFTIAGRQSNIIVTRKRSREEPFHYTRNTARVVREEDDNTDTILCGVCLGIDNTHFCSLPERLV